MMKHGEICGYDHEISVLVLFHCCLDTGRVLSARVSTVGMIRGTWPM